MGLNVRRDPLCLIQVSSGNSDAHIVQFDRENYQAPNLVKLLNDRNITKIFHYGRADLAYIKYYLKTDTNNILDTKIASKLARSYYYTLLDSWRNPMHLFSILHKIVLEVSKLQYSRSKQDLMDKQFVSWREI